MALALLGLALATAVGLALDSLGVRDPSSVYLLATAAVAIRAGTRAALVAAIGSFVLVNFLFVEPRYSLAAARPQELVDLVLLLTIGVVIGRLAGSQRDQARDAARREAEARSLFSVTRLLSTADHVADALPEVVDILAEATGVDRVWIGLGETMPQERLVGDSGAGAPLPSAAGYLQLQRAERGPEGWMRILPPMGASAGRDRSSEVEIIRVPIAGGGDQLGSLWAARRARHGSPSAHATRLLVAAADLIAQVVRRERLAGSAAELEITRRSEALKSALLDSVSHDLRTPLATIRTSAGSLADPTARYTEPERRGAAMAIDAEAERLAQFVDNLLEMSRIEGGALDLHLDLLPVSEIVAPVLRRLAGRLAERPVEIQVPDDLPLVQADPILADEAVANLVENVIRHAPADARLRITASASADGRVQLTIEDSGPGVSVDEMPRLFDKFYRGSRRPRTTRGTGLGLSVTRGLVEAMGGSVMAFHSDLGGLAVRLLLPVGNRRGPGVREAT